MKIKTSAPTNEMPPQIATHLLKGFSAYSRHYVRRHFHTIRILKNALPEPAISFPVVIYLNHASWWDPLVCLYLARKFFADRRSFAPIDEAALRQYGFFKQLGFYGIEQKSMRGAMMFLRTTCGLLGLAQNMVWLTPQGRFVDVRQRPLQLRHGVGALGARMEKVAFVPLAIEYTFWNEPQPEILLCFGRSTVPENVPPRSSRDWAEFFGDALEGAQDELAAKSSRRDPVDWIVLERGKSGISAIYDTWRWLRSRIPARGIARAHRGEEGA
jgi:1-acyl-sn-glycerol-3-phosphate acyltransferase